MEKFIKEFKGHSGSTVQLYKNKTGIFVRKTDNVERNYERLSALVGYVDVPKILAYDGTVLDMEYIHGQDMKSYLTYNTPDKLLEFLHQTITVFSTTNEIKDYTETYYNMLSWITESEGFPFTKEELINKLPKLLPKSMYHGDMTLENIMYSMTDRFYLIDAVTVSYDSWVFDIAKLRQDLVCKWFLRNDNLYLDSKLEFMNKEIEETYKDGCDDNLLILMLLRVYRHCTIDSVEYNFIMREIQKLWK